MKTPEHNLQLVTGSTRPVIEHIEIVTARPRRGAPVFHAPTLPTLQQMNRELPFTENLRSRHPLP